MTAKIKYCCFLSFLTAFLVSAVCFLSFFGNFASANTAADNAAKIGVCDTNVSGEVELPVASDTKCLFGKNTGKETVNAKECLSGKETWKKAEKNTVEVTEKFFSGESTGKKTGKSTVITFEYKDKTFVYDQSKIVYDKFDHDTVAKLTARGFFADAKSKLAIINEAQKLGFDVATAVNYVFTGLDEVVAEIDSAISYEQIDSVVTFKPNAQNVFSFSQGKDGLKVDVDRLYQDVKQNVAKGSFTLQVPANVVKAVSAQENKNKTVLKSSFATAYANSSADRKSNVKRALSKFNGKIVQPGEVVSFNDTVGERTEKNGYKNAKIILNGKYVDGIGGGVCQASTTLYNAVLTAGLQIDEWHRHTLKSSYVKPSFDAMVNSNGADLVFANNTDSPIYIKTACDDVSAKVYVYGVPNEFEIERRYKVIKQTPAKIKTIVDTNGKYADLVTYDDEQVFLQKAVDGLTTEGYLVYKKNGKAVAEKLIRRDTYQSVEGVAVRGSKPRPIVLPDDVLTEEFEGIR